MGSAKPRTSNWSRPKPGGRPSSARPFFCQQNTCTRRVLGRFCSPFPSAPARGVSTPVRRSVCRRTRKQAVLPVVACRLTRINYPSRRLPSQNKQMTSRGRHTKFFVSMSGGQQQQQQQQQRSSFRWTCRPLSPIDAFAARPTVQSDSLGCSLKGRGSLVDRLITACVSPPYLLWLPGCLLRSLSLWARPWLDTREG